MKILQIVPELEQGGVEWDAVELALALHEQGIENGIASAGGGLVDKLIAAGIPHHRLPLTTKNPLKIVRNAGQIARLVKTEGYDLVHVRSRAPAWSVHIAATRAGFPWLATFHGVYGTKPRLFKLPYNRVMLKGRKTICVSRFVQRHVETTYAPPRDLLCTIHDGADTSRFHPEAVTNEALAAFRQKLGLDASIPLVVMVGRLTRWKGQHVLLEAIRLMQHRVVTVLFVGSDQGRVEYTQELKALANSLPQGKRAVFLERSDEMPLVYAAGTVTVNASSGQPEAFGRVITEAQAMGAMVIGTAHGGACETIADGETGFLVPPGDPAALAQKLDAILDLPDAARQRYGQAARESVQKNFSIAQTCQKTLAIYRQLLNS